GQGTIDGREVLLYDSGAALAVRLLDRLLDLNDRLLAWQDAADREETGLHDRVHAVRHAGGLGHLVAIDHEQPELLRDDRLLDRAWQMVPDVTRAVRAVQQHGRARRG